MKYTKTFGAVLLALCGLSVAFWAIHAGASWVALRLGAERHSALAEVGAPMATLIGLLLLCSVAIDIGQKIRGGR